MMLRNSTSSALRKRLTTSSSSSFVSSICQNEPKNDGSSSILQAKTSLVESIRKFSDSTLSSSSSSEDNNNNNNKYYTGFVRSYNFRNRYGFIRVDTPIPAEEKLKQKNEVYVGHYAIKTKESELKSSSATTASQQQQLFTHRPHLVRHDRVKFNIRDGRAINVTFENGQIIPYFREGHANIVMDKEIMKLGSEILRLFANADSSSSSSSSSATTDTTNDNFNDTTTNTTTTTTTTTTTESDKDDTKLLHVIEGIVERTRTTIAKAQLNEQLYGPSSNNNNNNTTTK